MRKLFLFMFFFGALVSNAQVGIGTLDPKGVLDVQSDTTGILIPRVIDTNAVATPIESVLIFDLDSNAFAYYDGNNWKYFHSNEKAITFIDNNGANAQSSGSADGVVKVNINQFEDGLTGGTTPGFISLAGLRNYQNLLQNGANNGNPGGVQMNPSFVTGEYPKGDSEPTDVITGPDANSQSSQDWGGELFEAEFNNQANFFRVGLEMQYNSGATSFTNLQIIRVQVKSIQSGAIVFSNSFSIPPYSIIGTNTFPMSFFFQSIADANSINTGYEIVFDPIGSLGGAVNVRMVNIARISAARSVID